IPQTPIPATPFAQLTVASSRRNHTNSRTPIATVPKPTSPPNENHPAKLCSSAGWDDPNHVAGAGDLKSPLPYGVVMVKLSNVAVVYSPSSCAERDSPTYASGGMSLMVWIPPVP